MNNYSKHSSCASVCCLGFRNFLPAVSCHLYTQVCLRLERCCYSVKYHSMKHNYHGFLWIWHLLLVKIPYIESLGEPGTRHYSKSVPFGHPANAVLSFIQMWSVKKNHIFDEPWSLAQETWNKLFINYWNQLIENMLQPCQKETCLPRCTT